MANIKTGGKNGGNDTTGQGGNQGNGGMAKDLSILSADSGITEDQTSAALSALVRYTGKNPFFSLQPTEADAGTAPSTFTRTVLGAKVSVDADGNVQYDASGIGASLQHLGQGESLVDSFSYTLKPGNGNAKPSTATVKVEIAGLNDAPQMPETSTFTIKDSAADDTPGVMTGKLGAQDADANDVLTYTVLKQGGSGGNVSINADGSYTFSVDPDLIDTLRAKESLTTTLEVQVKDPYGASSTGLVNFVVQGANDTATITGDTKGEVVFSKLGLGNGRYLPATGTLAVHDPDTGEAGFSLFGTNDPKGVHYSLAGHFGFFTLDPANGMWEYSLAPTAPAFTALADGQDAVDVFTVRSLDGSASKDVAVTVHGKDDPAQILGVKEPFAVEEDGVLSAGGVVQVIDPDKGQDIFQPVEGLRGTYGDFSFNDLKGAWGYTLRNADPNVQALGEGQVVHDRLHLVSLDGSAEVDLVIDITGRGDMSVADDTADPVPTDSPFASINVVSNDTGVVTVLAQGRSELGASVQANPDGTVDYNGKTLDWSRLAGLRDGERLTDHFDYTAVGNDGSQQVGHVSIDIIGRNDAPVIQGMRPEPLFDTADPDGGTTASGKLSFTDPDSSHLTVAVSADADNKGSLTLGDDGSYVYTLPPGVLDAMPAGEFGRDRFEVRVTDDSGASTGMPLAFNRIGADDKASFIGSTTHSITMWPWESASGTLTLTDPDRNEAGIVRSTEDNFIQYGYLTTNTVNSGSTSTVSWNYYVQNDIFLAAAVDASPDSIVVDRQTLVSLDDSARSTLESFINGSKTYLGTLGVIEHFDANDMLKQNFSSPDTTIFLGSQQIMATDSAGNQVASTQLNFKVLSSPVFGSTIDLPTVVLVGYTGWHDDQLA